MKACSYKTKFNVFINVYIYTTYKIYFILLHVSPYCHSLSVYTPASTYRYLQDELWLWTNSKMCLQLHYGVLEIIYEMLHTVYEC